MIQAKVKVRTKLNVARVKQKVLNANERALKIAGADVQEKTRRQMSNRTPLSRPKQWVVGNKDGAPLVALVRKIPKPDRVTSWRTRRSPRGFLLNDIKWDYSNRRVSVAIGPEKIPQLNKLHEFGGSITVHFNPGGKPKRSRKFKGAVFGTLSNKKTDRTIYSFSRRVKGRGYMAKGLAKSLRSIPAKFRDTIKGP
jgi:hypothetical protein